MTPGHKPTEDVIQREVQIDTDHVVLEGTLAFPASAHGVVLFVHGSGSSRHSPRNRYVAQVLQSVRIATLLFDLLTRAEESVDLQTGELRFNIGLLAERLIGATRWLLRQPDMRRMKVGYFGASTGAAAALVAAAQLPDVIAAVVSRGGRPDLAESALESVRAPTLLIVGERDEPVIAMNRQALVELGSPEKKLVIVPGATHLFEAPGTLEEVARIAAEWFAHYLAPAKSLA
jgi:putative phosphoribosyl transferase